MNDIMAYPSSRHDGNGREYSGRDDWYNGRRSNFLFADGHCDFINRRAAVDARRYQPGYDGPALDTVPLD